MEHPTTSSDEEPSTEIEQLRADVDQLRRLLREAVFCLVQLHQVAYNAALGVRMPSELVRLHNKMIKDMADWSRPDLAEVDQAS
jgi:hypothetical protein